ncbi:MFS transporter [Puia sp. P3]|uniref:MFS transporter n=1 Tax=Puia sp. P3 TaxID=3423952 RepID=UPI003D67CAB0
MGGPILGGALADAGLWRYIFFINLPIGLAALVILRNKVSESRSDTTAAPIDFPGVITIALGLACLTFGFLRMPALGFGNWQVWFTLFAGLLLLILFIVIEKKSASPMMPLALFANSNFSGANLLTLFLYAGLGTGMLFLSLNMIQARGYTQLQSGLTFLPFTVLMITIARPAGTLADKFGPRRLLILGPAAAGAGLLILSFVKQTKGAPDYMTSFLPGIFLFGAGMAFTVAPLTTTVMRSVSDEFSGTASGINNAVSRIANVFANAVFGALAVVFFSTSIQKHLPQNFPDRPAIIKQSANLGNAAPPASLDATSAATARQAYRESFIETYGRITRCAAALAFLGSLMALLFIRRQRPK